MMHSISVIIFLSTLAFAFVECQPIQDKNVTDADILSMMSQLSRKVEGLEYENLELKGKLLDMEMKQLQMEIKDNEQEVISGNDVPEDETRKELQELHSITFDFPRQENINDRVKYLLPVPQLEELTTCFWVAPEDLQEAWIVSYATSTEDDAMIIALCDENTFCVTLGGTFHELKFEGFDFQANEEVHLCVALSFYSKYVSVYENGKFKERKEYAGAETKIAGGGALYFGQDQDSVNGGFSSAQAFKGKISNFMIWPRTLSAVEIRGIASTCTYPRDFILRPQLTNIQWNGNVKVTLEETCLMADVTAP